MFPYKDPAEIKRALEYQQANNCKIGEAFVKLEACSQEKVTRALATHFQLPFANLSKHKVPDELIQRVPKDVALEHKIGVEIVRLHAPN